MSSNPNHSPRSKKSDKKITRKVSPPLSSTRLTKLIYILVGLSTILIAFYSYRIYQWKTEVGGWWSLVLHGRQSAGVHHVASRGKRCDCDEPNSVEASINALAQALGMPSRDLAIAIAGAVREYVPPASLSSIREKETGGPAVEELLKAKQPGETVQNGNKQTGVIEDVMDSFVGMDEP